MYNEFKAIKTGYFYFLFLFLHGCTLHGNILFHSKSNQTRCAFYLNLSLSVDEGFYGAVNSLVNQSRRPILMTTSHPAFCPVIAKLVKKPLHVFTFRFRATLLYKLCPGSGSAFVSIRFRLSPSSSRNPFTFSLSGSWQLTCVNCVLDLDPYPPLFRFGSGHRQTRQETPPPLQVQVQGSSII